MAEEIEQREINIVGWHVVYDSDDEPIAAFRKESKARDYADHDSDCFGGQILEAVKKKDASMLKRK
ncbi:MAG: hypothetical protein WA584_23660 [Pyrinomonadaceae bacterium]